MAKKGKQYLLRKLIEEAGEVIHAAAKITIHGARKDLMANLEGEVADIMGIIYLMRSKGHINSERVGDLRIERIRREKERLCLKD